MNYTENWARTRACIERNVTRFSQRPERHLLGFVFVSITIILYFVIASNVSFDSNELTQISVEMANNEDLLQQIHALKEENERLQQANDSESDKLLREIETLQSENIALKKSYSILAAKNRALHVQSNKHLFSNESVKHVDHTSRNTNRGYMVEVPYVSTISTTETSWWLGLTNILLLIFVWSLYISIIFWLVKTGIHNEDCPQPCLLITGAVIWISFSILGKFLPARFANHDVWSIYSASGPCINGGEHQVVFSESDSFCELDNTYGNPWIIFERQTGSTWYAPNRISLRTDRTVAYAFEFFIGSSDKNDWIPFYGKDRYSYEFVDNFAVKQVHFPQEFQLRATDDDWQDMKQTVYTQVQLQFLPNKRDDDGFNRTYRLKYFKIWNE